MKLSRGDFWNISGYPSRFVVDGIQFDLVQESEWFRWFKSDAPDEYLKNIAISRISDGSVSADDALNRLNSGSLSEEERESIVLALQTAGKL